MTIIRNSNNPTPVLEDNDISWAAKGLYCYLCIALKDEGPKIGQEEKKLLHELKESGLDLSNWNVTKG
jgi:hypothetical protein